MPRRTILARVLSIGCISIALVLPVGARQDRQPASAVRLEHQTYKLPNGLTVILSPDKRLPMVAVNLWYHVGPANERPGRTGFAHLFEHMMFQGSKHVAADTHFKLLENAGASDINGTTDFDRTNYFETVPANQLELALWIESDRLGYLLDVVDQKALANQIDVVRNERRQSVENRPYGVAEEALYQAIYPAGHPYHGVVIGSHADLAAVSLPDVQEFFRQFYTPNNASLAIVGDFDPTATRALIEKYFGTLKRGSEVQPITATTPAITGEKRLTVTDTVQLPRVYMAWLTPAIFKPGDAEADLVATILGGGKSSRLYKSLVYDKQIAQNVSATQESLILGSKFTVEATAKPGHTAEELEAAINAELNRFLKEGTQPAELERAKNTVLTRIVEGLETLGGFGGKADRLNMYEHYLGTPDYLGKDLERYSRATLADLASFTKQYLRNDARVIVFAVPGEKKLGSEAPAAKAGSGGGAAQSVNTDEPWRATKPAATEGKAAQIPSPSSSKLPNGLTVIVKEERELPIVSASLVFASGSGDNPPDFPGLANFTAAMLDEGTSTRSALQIADDAARLGTSIATGSTMDQCSVSITSLAPQFPAAMDLIADVALHPAFPEDEISRQRSGRQATLVSQKSNPNAVATRVTAAVLYGNNHPYGYNQLGTETSNASINRDAMVKFWRERFVPGNAALVVVGAVSAAEVQGLAKKVFGGWTGNASPEARLGAPVTTPARVVLVDMPGAAQTQIRVAGIGAARSTADFAPIEVMNAVLGGLFTSRLNMNLREDKGYTYGAFSAFDFRRTPGPFTIGAGVRTDVTAPAITEMLKEARRIGEAALGSEELGLGKDSLVRSLPGRFETSARAVDSFATLFVHNLGIDYYSKYPALVNAVDAGAVQAAARKYVVPDRLIVVVVGDKSKIDADIRKLNLGAIEYRDAEGKVLQSPPR